MKIVVLAMVSLALIASLEDQVAAAPLRNKKQAHQQHTMTKPLPRPQQGGGDYYENVLDKVPFGTERWWNIKQRRSGGGGYLDIVAGTSERYRGSYLPLPFTHGSIGGDLLFFVAAAR